MNGMDALHGGGIYDPNDPAILAVQRVWQEKQYEFNNTRPSEMEKRTALLKEMFEAFGEGSYVEPPLHANWGGRFVRFGKNVYANYGLTLVDDTHITVGDSTMFGPNVVLATGGHPVLPQLRARALQYNLPIVIGKNCWLGAGVIVLPGVVIGDNAVVGAGSVVTRDIPANVVAVGNPCRVVRPIGERDRAFYYRDKRIDPALLDGSNAP